MAVEPGVYGNLPVAFDIFLVEGPVVDTIRAGSGLDWVSDVACISGW